MYAFLSLVVFAAEPTLYIHEDKGEVEYRLESTDVTIRYYGESHEIVGHTDDVLSLLNSTRVKIPRLNPVSKLKEPSVTLVGGEVRVRFPVQYFGKDNFELRVVDDHAVVVKTIVTKETQRIPVLRR